MEGNFKRIISPNSSLIQDYIPSIDMTKLILWNKLDSGYSIGHSEIGPNGTIYGTLEYYNCQFGIGAQPSAGGGSHYAEFDATILNPEKGCVEFWIVVYSQPETGHEFHSWVTGGFETVQDNNITISYNGYGIADEQWGGSLRFNGTSRGITINETFAINVPIHIAMVWNREGINGSGDYIRLYKNGTIAGTNSTDNDWGTTSTAYMKIPNNKGWDGGTPAKCWSESNIKIWSYDKADFSDRFYQDTNDYLAAQIIQHTVSKNKGNSITSVIREIEQNDLNNINTDKVIEILQQGQGLII